MNELAGFHPVAGSRWSDAIWKKLPNDALNPNVGTYRDEDFANFGATAAVATNVGRYVGRAGVYKSYEDSGASISQIATSRGRIQLATGATNNNEVWLQACASTGILGAITSGASGKPCLFETRIGVNQIAAQNFFSGLTEEGLAAADTQADSGGAFADKDMIGFQVNEATPTLLDFVYRKSGGALQTIVAGIQTLVAGTIYRAGFVFDPSETPAERLKIFIDGVVNATKVTKANIEAATFPSGEEHAFLIGGKNNNADCTYFCEGWRYWQPY